MSPEMLELLTHHRQSGSGYTYAADYWSLGVLMYFMLVGSLPFDVTNEHDDVDKKLTIIRTTSLRFPGSVSSDCESIICSLLELNYLFRLGYGASGFGELRDHTYFSPLNWSVVKRGLIPPPLFYDFSLDCPALASAPLDHIDAQIPDQTQQPFFLDWYVKLTN